MENTNENVIDQITEVLEKSNLEMALLERLNEIKQRVEVISKTINTRTDHLEAINEDMILDFHDVCGILHLSPRQVRRYQSDELKGFLIGRKRLYRYSEVQAFIARRLEESQPENNN